MLKPKRTTRKELKNIVHPIKPWCAKFMNLKNIKPLGTISGIAFDRLLFYELKPTGHIMLSDGKIRFEGLDKLFTITDPTT